MMKVLVVVLALLVPINASAYIIDTGVIEPDKPFMSNHLFERELFGLYTFENDTVINSIENYFVRSGQFYDQTYPNFNSAVALTIHKGTAINPPDHPTPGIVHPDMNNLVFKEYIYIPAKQSTSGWIGLNNLNVNLTPGEYWFGIAAGRTFDLTVGAPQIPLDRYVGKYDFSYFGSPEFGSNFALRVDGITTPEPATMLLMGGGLAGAFWRRRRIAQAK